MSLLQLPLCVFISLAHPLTLCQSGSGECLCLMSRSNRKDAQCH